MTPEFPYPTSLLIADCLAAVAVSLLIARRTGAWVVILLATGLLAAAMAAGGLRLAVPSGRPVQVLVDASPSTRTAQYLDPQKLKERIRQLLADQPYEVTRFDSAPTFNAPTLLFSDGQFEPAPTAGPVFCVIDPARTQPADARVIDVVAERGQAIATVSVAGSERVLRHDGHELKLPAGRYRIAIGDAAVAHDVAFAPGDPWSENDRIAILPQAADGVAKWSCGVNVPGSDSIAAVNLPSHAGAMAACSILLLDTRAAVDLTDAQQQAIASWVRNLGGSLVLVAQDDGWSRFRGSALNEISPLSPDPPASQREWVILIDASGSMAQEVNGEAKWLSALSAGQAVLHALPAADSARVGLFSDDLRWVASGKASDIQLLAPTNFVPRGPTNLDRAFDAIASLSAGERDVILLTDAEVDLTAPASSPDALREKGVRVSSLMLSDGRGKAILERLASATGGMASSEVDPRLWAPRAAEMAGRLAPGRWQEAVVTAVASSPLPAMQAELRGFGRAFAREGADVFARGGSAPLAAGWQVGLGHVATVAFAMPSNWAGQLAQQLERRPADDRYSVEWLDGAVEVNGPSSAELVIHISGAATDEQQQVPAIAPGQFRFVLPDLSAGAHIVITDGSRLVARRSFSPRYAREFAAIGNNLGRLQQLAAESGGRVIEPGDLSPIPELQSRRFISLTGALGALSIAGLAAGVLVLRRRV